MADYEKMTPTEILFYFSVIRGDIHTSHAWGQIADIFTKRENKLRNTLKDIIEIHRKTRRAISYENGIEHHRLICAECSETTPCPTYRLAKEAFDAAQSLDGNT